MNFKKKYLIVIMIYFFINISIFPNKFEIMIDGKADDWIKTGLIFTDNENDVQPMDKNKAFSYKPEDDIKNYAFYQDGTYLYVMISPFKMPEKGEQYYYRMHFLVNKNDIWHIIYAFEWSNIGGIVEANDPETFKPVKESITIDAVFAQSEVFEAKIPLKSLRNMPWVTYVEPAIWHSHHNAIDTGHLKEFTISQQKALYTIDLTALPSGAPRVQIEFQNFCLDKAVLGFYYTKIDLKNIGAGIKIENVKAFSKNGKELSVIKNADSVTIQNQAEKNFIVQYEVPVNQSALDRGKGYYDFFNRSCFLGSTDWTFLCSKDSPSKEHSMKIICPPEWKALTQWGLSNEASGITDASRFFQATFAAGNLEIREQDISGTVERIALDSTFTDEEKNDIFNNCFFIYKFIKSVFKANGPENHLSVFARCLDDGIWQHGNESALSHAEPVCYIETAYGVQEHRVFHTYNCFPPTGIPSQATWFEEGPNLYYSDIVFIMLKTKEPFKELKNRYYNYYRAQRKMYDGILAGRTRYPDNWQKEEYLTYHKGFIVSFLLDREIRKITKNTRSLADLLAEIYSHYGNYKNGEVTDDILEKTASAIAGKSLKEFFNKYIYSTELINIDYLFADKDNDGLCLAAEELLGTAPEKADSDNDGISDYQEYLEGNITILKK